MARLRTRLAATVGILALASACGGEESEPAATGAATPQSDEAATELCQSLEDLQASVRGLQDIELGEGAVEELEQAADEITADAEAVQSAAGEEVSDEAAAFEASAQALITDAEAAAAAGELTSDSLQALAGSISSAVSAFQALQQAAPDCDL